MENLADNPTRAKRRRGKRLSRRILFPLCAVGLGLLCAFLVGELCLRAFVTLEGKGLATYDELLGWRGRPNGKGLYIRTRDRIRVSFQYNNLGYRDEDVLPKPADGKRLLMLGDSFIENLEVDYSATFPSLLEVSIKSKSENWDVAIVGSRGYSTAQELLAFRKFRALINPDAVLLCFYCGNDFEDNLRERFASLDDQDQLLLPTRQDPSWKHELRRFQRWLYETSHVVYLLKNSLQSMANLELWNESKAVAQVDEQTTRLITKKLLLQLAQEVDDAGAAFAVVVIPCRDELSDDLSERKSFITQVCAENQIKFLDLTPFLSAKDYFETDIHFNPLGHAAVSKALDAFVAESLVAEIATRQTLAN